MNDSFVSPATSPVRVLIQTVGTGGPNNPVWEALVFAVNAIEPHILVHFCSRQTAADTLPEFFQKLGEQHFEHRTLICEDPDDVEKLTFEFGAQVDQLKAEFPTANFSVDFTSGTKPMSSAAVAVAISRRIPKVCYATGPRDETGRAYKTTKLQTLDTGALVAERLLDELGRLFNLGQFEAVQVQAASLSRQLQHDRLKARAETLALLADAYAKWDRFDWKGAAAELRKVTNLERRDQRFTSAGWNLKQLEEQLSHLEVCRDTNTPSRCRELDLLVNIDRRIADGQYDDAISRLYRLTELTLQERFAAKFLPDQRAGENPTSVVPIAILKTKSPKAVASIAERKSPTAERWDLGASDTMQLLSEAGDPIGDRMWLDYVGVTRQFHPKTNGKFYNLMEARNNSWLAHGSKAADERVARELREYVGGHLALHFQSPVQPEEHPADLASSLAIARFAKCPWV